jgi:hypothetical protein
MRVAFFYLAGIGSVLPNNHPDVCCVRWGTLERWFLNLIVAIVVIVVGTIYLGFSTTWKFFSLLTNFVPYLVTGAIVLVFGLSFSRDGSLIYKIVAIAIFLLGVLIDKIF